MKVTYYNYNFPFTETYQYWDITYHKKSGSEGLVKIVAEIKPSFSELLKFLKERRLVNSDDIATNIWGAYIAQSSNGKRFGEALRGVQDKLAQKKFYMNNNNCGCNN